MLEAKDVSSSYGSTTVLEHVNFHFCPSKLTVILGKNGAGKSTLLKCLQQQQSYSGTIYLNGKNIKEFTLQQLTKIISFLPQHLPCPNVTVGELASFGRYPYLGLIRRLSAVDITAISKALELTGMTDYCSRVLTTLSGGEKQRAYLSMILAQTTDIIVLDEPTTHLDIITETQFLRLLKNLTLSGKTIVLILHNLDLAVRFADNIIILDDKRCVFNGTTAQCLSEKKIEEIFHVKRLITHSEDGQTVFFTA